MTFPWDRHVSARPRACAGSLCPHTRSSCHYGELQPEPWELQLKGVGGLGPRVPSGVKRSRWWQLICCQRTGWRTTPSYHLLLDKPGQVGQGPATSERLRPVFLRPLLCHDIAPWNPCWLLPPCPAAPVRPIDAGHRSEHSPCPALTALVLAEPQGPRADFQPSVS